MSIFKGHLGRGMQPFRARQWVFVIALLAQVLGGCLGLCPERSASVATTLGRVEQLDCATRRRLRFVGQQVGRDRAGHLVARATTRNVAEKDYVARIRVTFFDSRGRPEQAVTGWDKQAFRAHRDTTLEWTSATPEAQRYLIEVRKDSFFVF